jgi:hypothetical protein
LLLSVLWDVAFDRALVTFDNGRTPTFSSKLSLAAHEAIQWTQPIQLADFQREALTYHQKRFHDIG